MEYLFVEWQKEYYVKLKLGLLWQKSDIIKLKRGYIYSDLQSFMFASMVDYLGL